MIRGFEDIKNEKDDSVASVVKPKYATWRGLPPRQSVPISPTLAWYERENVLRHDGKMNEIDTNEIKAALNGTINKWTPAVKAHREIFEAFDRDPEKAKWSQLIDLRNNPSQAIPLCGDLK